MDQGIWLAKGRQGFISVTQGSGPILTPSSWLKRKGNYGFTINIYLWLGNL